MGKILRTGVSLFARLVLVLHFKFRGRNFLKDGERKIMFLHEGHKGDFPSKNRGKVGNCPLYRKKKKLKGH